MIRQASNDIGVAVMHIEQLADANRRLSQSLQMAENEGTELKK